MNEAMVMKKSALRIKIIKKEVIMKSLSRVILAVVIGLAFSVSTVFAADPPFSGFLGGASDYKMLKPGPKGGVKLRWMKPGVDFSRYNKFMVDSVIFYMSDKSENKGIDPQLMKEMADAFNKELVAAFKDKYPMVSEPGPDVARIRIAITNIKQSKPVVSAVTTVVPVGLAVSVVKKGATGGWTGSGETSAEMQVLDSTTYEIIGMAVDEQKADFTARYSKTGSAKDAFNFWSERIVLFLDTVHKK